GDGEAWLGFARSSWSRWRSGKRRSVSDQRPCVAVIDDERWREKRRRRSAGRAASKRRFARSGVQASFVASPAQTRSQSAGRTASASSPVAATRSYQNSALRPSASLIRSYASPSGRGAPARSEERRVGKECRARRAPEHERKKNSKAGNSETGT